MDLTMPASDVSMRRLSLFPARKRLSMASLLLAFLFPYLTWEQAAGCALLLLLFTTLIRPWLRIDLTDRASRARGVDSAAPGISQTPPGPLLSKGGGTFVPVAHSDLILVLDKGITLYTISVLALILLYRHHLYIAAGAWALMALGDGMATVIGEAAGGPSLPWNRQKTWAGFASFAVAGMLGAYILTRWIAPQIPSDKTLIVCAAAALLGAVLESLPLSLDDNITVPLVVGAFMFCAYLMERSALDSNLPYLGRRMVLAIAMNLVFALLARAFGAASRSGAICGSLLGTAIYLGYGYKSFLLLFAFVFLGSVATRVGFAKKAARGVAERRGGARSWREALANLLAPALLAVLVITTHHEPACLIALVAALAEAAGDTVSSEIGQWASDRAYLITTFKLVPAGEDGGVSLPGTAAGLAASTILMGLGMGLGLCGPYRFAGPAIALAAAGVGNLLDSFLGATLQRRGLVTNGMVNFAGTSVAGMLALGLALHLGL